MKNKTLTIIFIIYVLIFAVGSVIVKDREFSDMENRNLSMLPNVSGKAVVSGEFADDFENYMSDQIVFKDFLVKLKVTTNRLLGQTKVSDVFFGDDGMLIKEYNNPYMQLSSNISYINEFSVANPDFNLTWLVVPNSSFVYSDRLPRFASCYDQNEVMAYIIGNTDDRINIADCRNELLDAKDEYIFYNTDHHWTANGSYIGYAKLCEALGIEPNPKEAYDIETVSDDFLGTLYSSAPTFNTKKDSIIAYTNKAGKYSVYYEDTGVTTDSLYNYDNLNIKDKYKFYLDGNHSFVKITSNSANEGKLLVVKDSYAHSLLPLLADHYSEIYVVDLRYYHQSVSELARANDIKDIVFINNIDFISTDNNFLWLQ